MRKTDNEAHQEIQWPVTLQFDGSADDIQQIREHFGSDFPLYLDPYLQLLDDIKIGKVCRFEVETVESTIKKFVVVAPTEADVLFSIQDTYYKEDKSLTEIPSKGFCWTVRSSRQV